jgi:hypothetical protein
MSVADLHEPNQRYVRLSDRARSQWTFYQFLQAVFKHLAGRECPAEYDFQELFARLREASEEIGTLEAGRVEKNLTEIGKTLDRQARGLLEADTEVPPSLLRRFFDRLRRQDEKVLLAVIKFYLAAESQSEDTLDKLDILFTRLAEIPREDGSSLVRERHEIERMLQPLLAQYPLQAAPANEVTILLTALADLRSDVLATRTFTELLASGVLDRFRTLKRRLRDSFLDLRLLPSIMETTVTIKNRFRELWEDEEPQMLDDTNRVIELRRHFLAHPEILTPELRDALETFASLHQRFDKGRQQQNLRREDVLKLRRTLTRILEHHDASQRRSPTSVEVAPPSQPHEEITAVGSPPAEEVADGGPDAALLPLDSDEEGAIPHVPPDPLLQDYYGKIIYAIELVGSDLPSAEVVRAKELTTLHLEPWEVEAGQEIGAGKTGSTSLSDERYRLFFQAAALRVRMDEEAREIIRLDRRGSERLTEVLERANQSLQRASDVDRRFQWFVEDALYRGDTEYLERLYRSRFRLLRAYSGLWLIHNELGGISPF